MNNLFFFIYLLISLSSVYLSHSQDLDKSIFFIKKNVEHEIVFGYNTNITFDYSYNNININSPLIYDFYLTNLEFNPNKFNSRLYTKFTFTENNFIDYTEYLRGCGPLDDGITNNIKSGGFIISMTIDNLVNNVIFPNGIFFRGK